MDIDDYDTSTEQQHQCAICLEQYGDEEEICYSHNPNCHHLFHPDCILAWLTKHQDCPCCRRQWFIGDTMPNTKNDDIETGLGDASSSTTSTRPTTAIESS